jgi:hypothetical protein
VVKLWRDGGILRVFYNLFPTHTQADISNGTNHEAPKQIKGDRTDWKRLLNIVYIHSKQPQKFGVD